MGEDEGGRKPFKSGYRPQFYFRTTDVTGTINLLGDRKMVLPGDMDVDMEVELIKSVAIEDELRFAIREGGRTVGAGTVTKNHRITSTLLMMSALAFAGGVLMHSFSDLL